MPHATPHGVLPAVITPFDSRERIDYAAWQQIIDRLIEAGVHGLFLAGGQGEFFSLTSTERREILRRCVEMTRGRVPVYIGTGGVTTRESIELTQAAGEAGVDYAVVITPYYLKLSQKELADHYLKVCRESSVPVIAYNIPERTGNELAADTVRRIAEGSERFIGLKDSSGDLDKLRQFLAIWPQIGRPFHIFMGRDHLILQGLRLGCAGAVAACANVIPELIVGVYEAHRRGDQALAERLQEQITPLRMAFSMGTFPVVIKEAMKMIGMPAGECRSPVGPLSAEEREKLRKIVTEARAAADAVPHAMAGAAD